MIIDPSLPDQTRRYFAKSIALREAMLPHVRHYFPLDNARGVFIEGVRFDGAGDFVLWGKAYREGVEVPISDGPENGWPLIVRNAPVERWPDRVALVKSILADLPGLRHGPS